MGYFFVFRRGEFRLFKGIFGEAFVYLGGMVIVLGGVERIFYRDLREYR